MSWIQEKLVRMIAFKTVKTFNEYHFKGKNLKDKNLPSLLELYQNSPLQKKFPVSNFKDIPLTEWSDYELYLQDARKFKISPLTHKEIEFLCQTSGTSGKRKYLPYTSEFIATTMILPRMIMASILTHFKDVKVKQLLNLTSNRSEEAHEDGKTPVGYYSYYQYKKLPQILNALYAIPKHALDLDDVAFLKSAAYNALHSDLSHVFCVTPHKFELICEYIRDHWNELSSNGKRASYLKTVSNNFIFAKEVWPNLGVICCWTRDICSPVILRLEKNLLKGIHVTETNYATTEGMVAVSHPQTIKTGQILNLYHQWIEFLPIDSDPTPENLLSYDQIEVGKTYEIVISNHLGLFRYKLRDIIECLGKYQGLPVIGFVGKADLSLILGHTRINVMVLRSVLKKIEVPEEVLVVFAPHESNRSFDIFVNNEKAATTINNHFDIQLMKDFPDYAEDISSSFLKKSNIYFCKDLYAKLNSGNHLQSKLQVISPKPLTFLKESLDETFQSK